MRPRITLVPAALLSLVLAGCGSGQDPSSGDPPSQHPRSGDVVEGMFEVGGHQMYLRCEGTGTPTVVYLHGSIEDPNAVPHEAGTGFQRLLAPDYRTCVYDRRNVGDSETVDSVQSPTDALNDMHRLLDVANIEPPYVLVGASFGGMIAYLYANEHPDEVAGMVLLDAMFPDELALEYLFPPQDRYGAYSESDEDSGLERISHYKVLSSAQPYIGHEPPIPVTYLASTQEGYEDNDYGIPEYNRRVLKLQAAYVHRFAPGRRIEVDTPHFMEPVIPDQIADEVRRVIKLQHE